MTNLHALLVAAHESRDVLQTLRTRLDEARSEYSEAMRHADGSYFSDEAKALRLERKELTERAGGKVDHYAAKVARAELIYTLHAYNARKALADKLAEDLREAVKPYVGKQAGPKTLDKIRTALQVDEIRSLWFNRNHSGAITSGTARVAAPLYGTFDFYADIADEGNTIAEPERVTMYSYNSDVISDVEAHADKIETLHAELLDALETLNNAVDDYNGAIVYGIERAQVVHGVTGATIKTVDRS